MKTDYRVRAEKFARTVAKEFTNCKTVYDFENTAKAYNKAHHCAMKIKNGASRVVIIRSDYVIKFPRPDYQNNWAGNNETEKMVYDKAVKDGFAYLLAEITLIDIDGVKVAIMPRIKEIGKYYWDQNLTNEERWWVCNHIGDLHGRNYGYRDGKICIIDYAFI